MNRRLTWWLVVIAAGTLIAAAGFWATPLRPRLQIAGFRDDPSIGAVGIIPMADGEVQMVQRMISDARKSTEASRLLYSFLRKRFTEVGIKAKKTSPGFFCGRCPKGPALVYSLDDEGYAYFLFVTVTANSEATLDRAENGFHLLRAK